MVLTSALACLHIHWSFICLYVTSAEQFSPHCRDHRDQQLADFQNPAVQRCSADFQAEVPFQNHALPMQGRVIAIFADDRLDDGPVTRQALLVFVSKSGSTSMRHPLGSTTASPQPGSCCVCDFLAANSTGTKRPAEEIGLRLLFQRRFFRWRSRVLKLKPRLWQNSLRRIPLLTNSATNCCTSGRVRRLGADNSVFAVIGTLQHRRRLSNRCVGQTLTVNVHAQRHMSEIPISRTCRLGSGLAIIRPRQTSVRARTILGHPGGWRLKDNGRGLPCRMVRLSSKITIG